VGHRQPLSAECPLCGEPAVQSRASIPGRVRCECGMVYRPTAQPALTEGQFWDRHDYTDRAWMERRYGPRRRRGHQALVDRVGKRVARGRWLDVGCGPGDLLKEAGGAGWQTAGVDLSPRAVALARDVGLDVTCGRFPEDAPDGAFDVISIVYTLEYFEDPKPVLIECGKRLLPGGALVLQLKNFAFWRWAERFSRTQRGIWCPQDIRSYSPKTVTTLLHLTGFASVRALPAALPDRRLPNLGFAVLAALGAPPLSPSITVIAQTAHSASNVCGHTSPSHKETTS
jgi:SAM-dependent methyltransferase